MATIRELIGKNGKKRYHVEIRIKGYKPLRGTFDRKTDAQVFIGENESKMKLGKYVRESSAKKYTVNDLIRRYTEIELPQRESDVKKFEAQLAWWSKEIGARHLSNLTPLLLSECKDKLAKEPKLSPRRGKTPVASDSVRSNATINRYMACLSTVLSFAVKEYGWLDENPMLKVTKKKEPRGRVKFLEDKEVEKLLKACSEQSYELYLCVLIALSTGARYGEILGLAWRNVDLEHKQFHFIDTKNGDDRGVAITSSIYAELIEFQKVRNIKSDYIFTSKDGANVLYLRGQFDRALKAAKIKDFHFHDLRHTAASYLARNGASLLEIATILGHKTLAMVQRYSHLTKDHTAQVLENMNAKMFKNAKVERV